MVIIQKKKFLMMKVILFKPIKFMNLSGKPTYKIFDFSKIENTNNMIVFHDDLDLNLSQKLESKLLEDMEDTNGIKDIIKFLGKRF